MMKRLSLGLVALLLGAAPAHADLLEVKIAPFEGAYRIFNRPVSGKGANDPILLHLTIKPAGNQPAHADVKLIAEDIFGKLAGWSEDLAIDIPAGGKPVEKYVPFFAGPGYFVIRASARVNKDIDIATAFTDLGVVPAPYPGTRPDSLFASNTSGLKAGEDLALLAAIGMKVERVHFQARLMTRGEHWGQELPPGQPPPIDFVPQDKLWAETRAHGIWALPVVGYGLAGDLTEMATRLGMYGPPADYTRFVNTYLQILNHYPEITTVEFWNEPWIYGWNFAGTPSDYRGLQKQFCAAMLKEHPGYRIVAGNSTMFVVDNIEPDPSCWKGLLSGITHHPYTASTGASTYRSGDHLRSIDETGLIARRMKLPYAYLTEGGTQWSPGFDPMCQALQNRLKLLNARLGALKNSKEPDPDTLNKLEAEIDQVREEIARLPAPADDIYDARKVVQYYVKSALAGMFQGDAQWEIGYGPKWTKANTTFAVMTHFLEDRPPLVDIWPENELINGGIFANAKFVTEEVKALPRANELSARWTVPVPNDRADDKTKVAVIWGLTGKSNEQVDTEGTLTIADFKGLTVYDMTRRVIKPGKRGLVVPLTEAPVYITTDALSVMELRQRVANGVIENVTAVNLYALSLGEEASKPQELSVRMENQLNRAVTGTLHVKIDNSDHEISAPFTIEAAKLVEVKLPWPGVASVPSNQYGITLRAEIAAPSPPVKPQSKESAAPAPIVVQRQQVESVARFVRKTINTDADWAGVTPVLIDSQMLQGGVDLSRYLLDPHLSTPTTQPTGQRIVARVYTAYDDDNIYLGVAVNEDDFKTRAGEPTVKGRRTEHVTLPWKNGMPGGLGYATYTGDVFQFSFGFRDRVPGNGRQMNDPWAWKGNFYDVDYSYLAHPSADGDQLIRIWSADGQRRNGYQTEDVAGLGPIAGGKIRITRDEAKKVTTYAIVLPRAEVKLFDPSAGRCRFGFILYNSEPAGSNGLNWSDAAGVFDHWRSSGSFPPTWMQRTACQTFFGIGR